MKIPQYVLCFTLAIMAAVEAVHPLPEGKSESPPGPVHLLYAAEDPQRPIWISAELATAEDGSVDWEVLGESIRLTYENLKTWPSVIIGTDERGRPVYDPWTSGPRPDGVYWGPTHHDYIGRPPDGSLEELILHSRYIIRGRLIAQQLGFFDTEPATLLAIRVSHMVLPDEAPRTKVSAILYVAYPSAEIRIGEYGFFKGDPSFPPLPDVGDEVMFFDYGVALDAGRRIFLPESDKILVRLTGGEILRGQPLFGTHKLDSDSGLDELIGRISKLRHVYAVEKRGE